MDDVGVEEEDVPCDGDSYVVHRLKMNLNERKI